MPAIAEKSSHSTPRALSKDAVETSMQSVNSMIATFHTIDSQVNRRPPDESMAKVIKSLNDFQRLVDFLSAVENDVPDIVESHLSPKECRSVEKKLTAFLHKNGQPQFRRMHLHIIARAMSTEALSAWKKSTSLFVRFSYQLHTKKFETSFVAVMNTLVSE